MTHARRWWPALVLVLAAGCGGTATPEASDAPESQGVKPGPVVLDVTIFDGEVAPRGARIELKVGQPLTLSIRSDAAEEIHVHTDPEQEFAVKADTHKRVTFTVDRPGKVAVELHHLEAVIAEVLVRK